MSATVFVVRCCIWLILSILVSGSGKRRDEGTGVARRSVNENYEQGDLDTTPVNLRFRFDPTPAAAMVGRFLGFIISDHYWPKTKWGFTIELVNDTNTFVALCNTKDHIKTLIGQLENILNNSTRFKEGFLNLSKFAVLPSRANVTVTFAVLARMEDRRDWVSNASSYADLLYNRGTDVAFIISSYTESSFEFFMKSVWEYEKTLDGSTIGMMGAEHSGFWQDVMRKIRNLLQLCRFQKFVDDSQCYFVGDMFPYLYTGCLMFAELMSCVKYAYTVNVIVNETAHAKYCPGNFSQLPCNHSECTKTCERVTIWTDCDGMCGGYAGFQYALDNYNQPYDCCVLPLNLTKRPCVNRSNCSSVENATMLPDELEFRLRMADEKVGRGIAFICAAVALTVVGVGLMVFYVLVLRRRNAKNVQSAASDQQSSRKVVDASATKIAQDVVKQASIAKCPVVKQSASDNPDCKSISSVVTGKSRSSGSHSALTARSNSLQVKGQTVATKKTV